MNEPVDLRIFSQIVELNWKQPFFSTLISERYLDFITASAENPADSVIIRFTISTAAGRMKCSAIVCDFLRIHNSRLPLKEAVAPKGAAAHSLRTTVRPIANKFGITDFTSERFTSGQFTSRGFTSRPIYLIFIRLDFLKCISFFYSFSKKSSNRLIFFLYEASACSLYIKVRPTQ